MYYDVNNYGGVIMKLMDEISEKLNADGKADWVREPALVNELRAFIITLGYKAGNGDGE